MNTLRSGMFVCVLAVAVVASPRLVHAQPTPANSQAIAANPQWRVAFDRGMQSLTARRYAEAVTAFNEALGYQSTPTTRYNLALALRSVGRSTEAIEHFNAYLAAPEPGALPQRLDAIRQELGQLRAGLLQLQLSVRPPTAALRIDGRAVTLREQLSLDPGTHHIDLTADGFRPMNREVTGPNSGGGRVQLDVALDPLVAPAVPSAAISNPRAPRLDTVPPRRGLPGWVLPTAVAGAVGVVVGVVVVGLVLSRTEMDPGVSTSWGGSTEPNAQ